MTHLCSYVIIKICSWWHLVKITGRKGLVKVKLWRKRISVLVNTYYYISTLCCLFIFSLYVWSLWMLAEQWPFDVIPVAWKWGWPDPTTATGSIMSKWLFFGFKTVDWFQHLLIETGKSWMFCMFSNIYNVWILIAKDPVLNSERSSSPEYVDS